MNPLLGARVMDEPLTYSDSLVEVSEAGIRFRYYYFPAGTKFVRFSESGGQVLQSNICCNARPDRMPCITYDLLVKVRPWEFGSSPT